MKEPVWEIFRSREHISIFFRAPQIKPHRPNVRQCGRMKEEWELICIKEPKVFLSFGLVVSNLVVCLKEEILRHTKLYVFIAVVFNLEK